MIRAKNEMQLAKWKVGRNTNEEKKLWTGGDLEESPRTALPRALIDAA